MTHHAAPHSLLDVMNYYKPFRFPVSLETKYQVAEISLAKLNLRRKINITLSRVERRQGITEA